MEAHEKRSEFPKQRKASSPFPRPKNVYKLWKFEKKIYITLRHVYGACSPLKTTHRQSGWVGEKNKAAYEIVIYCFNICTILQNQEL